MSFKKLNKTRNSIPGAKDGNRDKCEKQICGLWCVCCEGNTVQLAVSKLLEVLSYKSLRYSCKENNFDPPLNYPENKTHPHEYDATRLIMTYLMARNYRTEGTNQEA